MMMGDLRVCSLPSEDGVLRRENHHCSGAGKFSVPSSAAGNTDTLTAEENWERAEEATREILFKIHPTVEADCKRKDVIEHVRGLIKSSLGFEVFPYGSVPLKTYLPDGDIDLTAICSPPVEDALFSDVLSVLRREEQNRDALYEVKDVHCIDAEVKLVKCIVQNMVVDISFNQLGGLSTLCFLEQVDQIVGKNHLFKHSVILIKAWCYYESRILGAHHGLISTYALETLILYIFHLFHMSLNGPLAALYKFLDYFSKFDWDNYCISLNGPVCKSSLPDIVVEPLDNRRGKLLLNNEFLSKCINMFSVPSKNPELNSRPFPQKHLNIVDPLKLNNNLGRSVNRGNFYRICSAFKYGARKLGQIFALPSERMVNELNKFFANTLDRHGSNYWNHVDSCCMVSCPRYSDNSSSSSSSSSLSDTSSEDNILLKSTLGCNIEKTFSVSSWGKPQTGARVHFSCVCGENGKLENGITHGKTHGNFVSDRENSCCLMLESKENHFRINNSACLCTNSHEGRAPNSMIQARFNNISENSTPASEEREFATCSFKLLLDLSGDYDSQFRSLAFGQYFHFHSLSAPMLLRHPTLPESRIKSPWETVHDSLQLKRYINSRKKSNGILGQKLTPNPPMPFSKPFNSEQKKKRGTGTYIPNMFHHSNKDGVSSGREKNLALRINGDRHKDSEDKCLAETSIGISTSEYSHDLSEAEYPYLGNGKPASTEVHQSHHYVWGSSNGNGISRTSEIIDSGCQELQPQGESLPERVSVHDSTLSPIAPSAQMPEPFSDNDNERVALESYHLKDEVEFPPLSHGRMTGT